MIATKLVDLPSEQVIELLTRAALAAYCVSEKISAKLALAKHLIGSGNRESALREVDSAIADASTDKEARSAFAEALCFRWNITKDDEDFRAARKALEELGRQEQWQPLASLLIDHGDYDDANTILKKALDDGDIVAHLLAVDVRLRMKQPDSARELLLTLAEDAIPSGLQYPYAHTMGLVALMCKDPALRRRAAMKLRKAVADTPLMKSAQTLLVALEADDAS
jgi:tetratricopeptide (TPR) repeat protein